MTRRNGTERLNLPQLVTYVIAHIIAQVKMTYSNRSYIIGREESETQYSVDDRDK